MLKIKGLNDSLVLIFEKGSFEEYCSLLEEKIGANKQLFNGSRVVFRGEGLRNLSHDEMIKLQKLCLDNGMILNNTVSESRLKGKPDSPATTLSAQPAVKTVAPSIPPVNKDIIIHRNLRSGQKLHSEGSVVIWGDVHESAEITAAGDIIILGTLGGIAHAGYYGNDNSIVFALNLVPGQIRIGNKISRASDDQTKRPYPEIAFLENGNICVQEYNSGKLPRR
ncbi:MAG: septum site-determining protein MinC [Syntrophomonadaceae bacterium]|nr:septum site-determining protein MinC [Syntrophomonadaceae bacterium]